MTRLETLSFVLAAATIALAGVGTARAGSLDSSIIAQAGTTAPGGTSTPGMGGTTSGDIGTPAVQNRNAGASGGRSGPSGGAGGAPVGTRGAPSSGSMGAIPARCAAIADTLARQQCIERARTK